VHGVSLLKALPARGKSNQDGASKTILDSGFKAPASEFDDIEALSSVLKLAKGVAFTGGSMR
jgi:hypothetical protein